MQHYRITKCDATIFDESIIEGEIPQANEIQTQQNKAKEIIKEEKVYVFYT